jgi:hypothetical protein
MIAGYFELKSPLLYVLKNTSNSEFKSCLLLQDDEDYLRIIGKILNLFIKPSTSLQG